MNTIGDITPIKLLYTMFESSSINIADMTIVINDDRVMMVVPDEVFKEMQVESKKIGDNVLKHR